MTEVLSLGALLRKKLELIETEASKEVPLGLISRLKNASWVVQMHFRSPPGNNPKAYLRHPLVSVEAILKYARSSTQEQAEFPEVLLINDNKIFFYFIGDIEKVKESGLFDKNFSIRSGTLGEMRDLASSEKLYVTHKFCFTYQSICNRLARYSHVHVIKYRDGEISHVNRFPKKVIKDFHQLGKNLAYGGNTDRVLEANKLESVNIVFDDRVVFAAHDDLIVDDLPALLMSVPVRKSTHAACLVDALSSSRRIFYRSEQVREYLIANYG